MDPSTLRNELEALGARLRRLWVSYGVLRLLAFVCAVLAVLFLLDRNLSLPRAVRIVFLVGLIAAAAWLVVRGVLYPSRRKLDAEDVACAVEERFPEFDGRLLSTLELEGEALDDSRNVSVEMVERLRRETGDLRSGVRLDEIFEYRHYKRMAGVAAALLLLVGGYAFARPDLSRIFAERLFGGDIRWPQRTFLTVVFPEQAEHFQVDYDGDRPTLVRIARGASLPVTVRSSGERPEFVELRARSDRGRMPATAMTGTGPSEWVGRFRAVRESFRFHPVGGDDDGHGRDVEVSVLTPPEVDGVTTRIEFPAYTGLRPREQERGDVEAPMGSRVEVRVAIDASVTAGELRFDGDQESIDLETAPADADGARRGTASFDVTESCSYSIHLVGDHGFKNLEPKSYAVIAVQDRPPTVRLLEPSRNDIDLTPEGVLAMRVAADDDYGLSALESTFRPFGIDESRDFDLLAMDATSGDGKRRLIYAHIDLRETPFPHGDVRRPPQVGDSYVYRVRARDNHAGADGTAAPNETEVTERRIDIVSSNEKLRLLTERQIRMKEEVRTLRDLQQEKRDRLNDVLVEFEASEGEEAPEVDDLSALEIGQTQVTNKATRLGRGFADVFEEYLLNRIDTSAAAERLIPMLRERKRASSVIDDFDFGVYRPLVEAYQSGSFGDLDVVGRMITMLGMVLDVAQRVSPDAGRSISDARLMPDSVERPKAIKDAIARQDEVVRILDELLEKLDEWEDYQGLVSEFRDLLDAQRGIYSRTRKVLKDQ